MEHAETGDGQGYSIRAVQRVCDILDLIQQNPTGFTLPQVVAATGLPKTSAFRYLATLEQRRYLRRDPLAATFHIGPAFLPLQSQQLDVLADRARPYLEQLRDQFGETTNLGILEGDRVSYIEIVESPSAVRLAARPGDRDPLHCTALGKAIAASLDPERVTAILDSEGMPKRTERTITDPTKYRVELDKVRSRGYAVDNRENEDGGRCVAVSLHPIGLPAAISLSAPAARFPAKSVTPTAARLKEIAGLLIKDITGTEPT